MLCFRPVAALLLLFGSSAVLAEEGTPPGEAAPVVEAAQVKELIAGLDAEQFLRRTAATEGLIALGAPAIEPLRQKLTNCNLEVASRGVYVLQELALSGDADTEEAAVIALEFLAENQVTAAARRARSALDSLTTVRQQRAVQRLAALGAKMSESVAQVQLQLHQFNSVVIDDEFRGGPDDLKQLRWLRDVQQLTLRGERIDDSWLKPVGLMPELAMLELKETSIQGRELAQVARHGTLRQLNIYYSPVGDASLPALEKFNSAAEIRLFGTELSPETAEKLRGRLAGTRIDFRRGAFLGIGGQTSEMGCQVTTVQPNTAAEAAGLIVGDVILRYNGEAAPDFETLTELIGKHKPGESVKLDLLRAGRETSVELELGRWP